MRPGRAPRQKASSSTHIKSLDYMVHGEENGERMLSSLMKRRVSLSSHPFSVHRYFFYAMSSLYPSQSNHSHPHFHEHHGRRQSHHWHVILSEREKGASSSSLLSSPMKKRKRKHTQHTEPRVDICFDETALAEQQKKGLLGAHHIIQIHTRRIYDLSYIWIIVLALSALSTPDALSKKMEGRIIVAHVYGVFTWKKTFCCLFSRLMIRMHAYLHNKGKGFLQKKKWNPLWKNVFVIVLAVCVGNAAPASKKDGSGKEENFLSSYTSIYEAVA